MKKRNSFTVACPRTFFFMALFMCALIVLIPVLFTIFSGPQHIAAYITFVLLVIPFFIFLLWAKLFKVTVSGDRIRVRRGTGVQYSFNVSEIVQVNWKTVITRMRVNEKITVRTASKHVSIETLMEGFDHMSAYILENVDCRKIKTYTKTIN